MQSSAATGYTVRQVAALTGIRETTLRMWQRRYAVVEPSRSPGGYRLYSDEDVERLRSMAALVADGVPASEAARRVSLPEEPADVPVTARMRTGAELDLVGAATSLSSVSLADVLDRALQFAPLDEVLDKWLMPELERLGVAWAASEVSVAQEHFASAGVMRALGRVFDELPNGDAPDVLVGLPEGSHHELGLLSFAVSLRRARGGVVYLGADVPVGDWQAAVATVQPRAVVIGVPLCSQADKAQAIVDGLAGSEPPVDVWVDGSLAAEVDGAKRLPTEVATAAAQVATTLNKV